MDFIPIVIAFFVSLVGVVGGTWKSENSGIKKVTLTGWVVIVLAILSCTYGIRTIHLKNQEIFQVDRIRTMSHSQITDGVNFLIRHLFTQELEEKESLKKSLDALTDEDYQRKIGQTLLVSYPELGGDIVSDGPLGVFENPYELYDANIEHGKYLLNDVLIKYARFLKPETIILINKVLHDDFFRNRFQFSQHKTLFVEDLMEKSPWNYLGLYYFNAVYWGGNPRNGDNENFNAFIHKVRKLIIHIRR